LSTGNSKRRLISFLNATKAAKISCSLLLDQTQDGNDMDEIFLVVTSFLGGHLELSPVGELNLYLFCFPLLMKISRGSIRDGQPNGRRALLAVGVS
jgi:hypothetical protein